MNKQIFGKASEKATAKMSTLTEISAVKTMQTSQYQLLLLIFTYQSLQWKDNFDHLTHSISM